MEEFTCRSCELIWKQWWGWEGGRRVDGSWGGKVLEHQDQEYDMAND